MSNVATFIKIAISELSLAGNVILKRGRYTIICKQLIIDQRKLIEKDIKKLRIKFNETNDLIPPFAVSIWFRMAFV